MVLSALLAGGGGEHVRLATNGLQFDGGSGRAAFMDDLMTCERTVAEMDRMVQLLYRTRRSQGSVASIAFTEAKMRSVV